MAYRLTEDIERYIEEGRGELEALLKTITLIPAPSHFEDARAAFIKGWLEDVGAEGVYIDGAKNVVYKMAGESAETVVFMAHTDTVFPMETPLIWREDGERIYCPGVGDDTASLAILLMTVKYILKRGIKPRYTVLFVANSCEEGLGNLKGSKEIVSAFGENMVEFYTFDGNYTTVFNRPVGSHRYKIECKTEGGHSYGAFGRPNAIVELSRLIGALYEVEVPKKENTKTTYNVGVIEGGTSVNTIAPSASILYEYRSGDSDALAFMQAAFERIVKEISATSRAEFSVEVVGVRPVGETKDPARLRRMTERVIEISQRHSGRPCVPCAASTDCNSAMALGIPAVCPGLYRGGSSHTTEEWIERASLPIGMRICAEIILDYFYA